MEGRGGFLGRGSGGVDFFARTNEGDGAYWGWRCCMQRRRGLTLLELVVILFVVAALIMILLPSMNCSRCPAKKTQCAANLKGMGATMNIYAALWHDELPVAGDGAGVTWLCDE